MSKDDSENRSEVAQRRARRSFLYALGGAGILSATGLACDNRGGSKTTQGTEAPQSTRTAQSAQAAQLVLPPATKDVTPFKVDVPQAALDDLERRLASTRW